MRTVVEEYKNDITVIKYKFGLPILKAFIYFICYYLFILVFIYDILISDHLFDMHKYIFLCGQSLIN